jgi:hypothetical protein
MTRSQLRSLTVTASATAMLLCAAAPAFAQDNPPPTSVPPPIQAMSAPKGSDDMTGSIGFGVGVLAGAQTLITPNNSVALKYWLSDVLAVSPGLIFNVNKPNGQTTAWEFNPQAVVLFVPFRSTSTRFSVGGGLGVRFQKLSVPNGAPSPNTQVELIIPIQAGVEHFFTRWFSMGIAAQSALFDYSKDVRFGMTIDTTSYLGQLFFYTD